jgi:hypothetical protein
MAKATPGHRIVLQLDPRVALEAIILNRLERIPTTRRQEWLRGLLVQGFRSECQVLRGTSDEAKRRPAPGFMNWVTNAAQKPVSHPEPEPTVAKVKPSQANVASKPFAALGKVIGQGRTVT